MSFGFRFHFIIMFLSFTAFAIPPAAPAIVAAVPMPANRVGIVIINPPFFSSCVFDIFKSFDVPADFALFNWFACVCVKSK